MHTYGTPAAADAKAVKRYGESRAKMGAVGESATADLLRAAFAHDSSVHVFHDLNIPGSAANIDHAVLRGRHVVLVDSKRWAPGFYWTISGKTFRGLKRFEPADRQTMALAKERIAQRLPRGVKVSTLTAVWSPGGATNLTFAKGHSGGKFCLGRGLGDRLRRMLRSSGTEVEVRCIEVLGGLVR